MSKKYYGVKRIPAWFRPASLKEIMRIIVKEGNDALENKRLLELMDKAKDAKGLLTRVARMSRAVENPEASGLTEDEIKLLAMFVATWGKFIKPKRGGVAAQREPLTKGQVADLTAVLQMFAPEESE